MALLIILQHERKRKEETHVGLYVYVNTIVRCSLKHDNMIVASVCIKQCISLDFHPCMYNTHGINTTSSTIAIMHMHIRTQREREEEREL